MGGSCKEFKTDTLGDKNHRLVLLSLLKLNTLHFNLIPSLYLHIGIYPVDKTIKTQ